MPRRYHSLATRLVTQSQDAALTAVHVPYAEPRRSRVPMAVAELALFIAAVGIWFVVLPLELVLRF